MALLILPDEPAEFDVGVSVYNSGATVYADANPIPTFNPLSLTNTSARRGVNVTAATVTFINNSDYTLHMSICGNTKVISFVTYHYAEATVEPHSTVTASAKLIDTADPYISASYVSGISLAQQLYGSYT